MPLIRTRPHCLSLAVALVAVLACTQARGQASGYGFQVAADYLPDEAPPGYVSVAATRLSTPLRPGNTYALSFTIASRLPRDRDYRLHPSIVPTKGPDLPYDDELHPGEVETEGGQRPELDVRRGRATNEGEFAFTLRPRRTYRYLTVLIEERDVAGVAFQPRSDLDVRSIYLEGPPLDDLPLAALPPRAVGPVRSDYPGFPWGGQSFTQSVSQQYAAATPIAAPRAEGAVAEVAPGEPDALAALPPAGRKHARPRKRHAEVVELACAPARLGLYDHKEVDGDIVTILLNGRVLVHGHLLTREVYYVDLPLSCGENEVVLHAENLGRGVPNTAAMIFEQGGLRREVVLRSDEEESASIRVVGRAAQPVARGAE